MNILGIMTQSYVFTLQNHRNSDESKWLYMIYYNLFHTYNHPSKSNAIIMISVFNNPNCHFLTLGTVALSLALKRSWILIYFSFKPTRDPTNTLPDKSAYTSHRGQSEKRRFTHQAGVLLLQLVESEELKLQCLVPVL